jgi:hemolysin activation/secretion protein
LVSSEQFSLGGLDTVRGYLESEALGDFGGSLQVEIRSPTLPIITGRLLNEARLFAFYDIGGAAIHDPLAQQTRSYEFDSTGVGIRVRVLDDLYGELADATTLANGPNTKAGTNRVLFRVYGEF